MVPVSMHTFGDWTMRAFTDKVTITKLLEVYFERILDCLRFCLDNKLGPVYRLVGPEYATPPYLPPEFFKEYYADG